METLKVKVDGKEYKVDVEESDDGKLKVFLDNETYEVETREDINQLVDDNLSESSSGGEDSSIVKAPLPGKVLSVNVKPGQLVKEGQLLIKFVAMKMENEITSPSDGKVGKVKVKDNDTVSKDDVLIILE